MKKMFVIAELGTSHGGDRKKARELVKAAAGAGADCVKFQIVYADEILHPDTGELDLPGGRVRLYDRFKQLETPPGFYREMKELVEGLGLAFLCTPFGLKSARELRALHPNMVKIASPELNYTALLRETAGWGLPIFLSTGVSKLADIEDALSTLEDGGLGREKVTLLHCVTAYPAPEADYNLRLLGGLQAVFGTAAGVSDHSMDRQLVPLLAFCQGAAAVEKHFCLSRGDPGLDDPIALPPADFEAMCAALDRAAAEGPEETLARLKRDCGAELVEAVLGDGVKRLAPSEKANYERTRRSIHAVRAIRAGEKLVPGTFAVLRTEKVLRPGLPPCWEERLPAYRAAADIPAGEGIRLEDICV